MCSPTTLREGNLRAPLVLDSGAPTLKQLPHAKRTPRTLRKMKKKSTEKTRTRVCPLLPRRVLRVALTFLRGWTR